MIFLGRAIKSGDMNRVRYLIETGIQNVNDELGTYSATTALHYASHQGKTDIAKYLLNMGANIEARDIDGWTPLVYASIFGYVDIVHILLRHGADVNNIDKKGRSILDMVIEEAKYNDVIKLLILYGASI